LIKKKIQIRSADEAVGLLGEADSALREMQSHYGIQLFLRQDSDSKELVLWVKGNSTRVERAMKKIKQKLSDLRGEAESENFSSGFSREHIPAETDSQEAYRTSFGKMISPRTPNQGRYIESIEKHDLVFGIGPAGTGKTFLAVACALKALDMRQIQRIIVTRPVVEAGEKLGFLPGDLLEKVDPYLRPIYDSFYSLLGPERFRMWRESEVLEIVPLAYMRGRTFENAFIILDEAQNTTPEQMKMFLTRMGRGSKAVVTGDVTQTDLISIKASGLVQISEILKNVEGVVFHHFTQEDVIRHPLIKNILSAYEKWEKRRG
jgi:phosphate starvation-inducible PhoH-like protein